MGKLKEERPWGNSPPMDNYFPTLPKTGLFPCVCLILTLHVNGMVPHGPFWDWLPSLLCCSVDHYFTHLIAKQCPLDTFLFTHLSSFRCQNLVVITHKFLM